ncbi:hypothetical protein [Holophaga foetida]|uniref:hypothetical protein n=1 Tax=Holophaga foetida TaxID=35839 RepID=UPI0011DCDD7C|nr:hypothetical protein [Holophaga foetida]
MPELTQFIDAWTIRAVVASRFLARLYRAMGDGRQASNAIQAGAPSEERAQRLGLAPRVAEGQAVFGDEVGEEIEKEIRAWQSLVESQAGISAFHAMVEGCSRGRRGLRGARQAAGKAFHRAVQGYRIAFPEEMAREGISLAIQAATILCMEAFLVDLNGDPALGQELHRNILEALQAAAGLTA